MNSCVGFNLNLGTTTTGANPNERVDWSKRHSNVNMEERVVFMVIGGDRIESMG
jgi:hypothetical protein